VLLVFDDRGESLRDFDPIVIGKDLDRQNLLDRCAVVARAAIDALEAVIAADHQKSSAALHVRFQRAQSVRRTLARNPGVRMEQKRVPPMSDRMTAS
jgi:hypothetical protein